MTEIITSEPKSYMDYTGPLVQIYARISQDYLLGVMNGWDWNRGWAICEMDGIEPTEVNMFQEVQRERMVCLNRLGDKLSLLVDLC